MSPQPATAFETEIARRIPAPRVMVTVPEVAFIEVPLSAAVKFRQKQPIFSAVRLPRALGKAQSRRENMNLGKDFFRRTGLKSQAALFNSARSHARAIFQSRSTVSG